MPVRQPRYTKEEFARRGDEIYDRDIRPLVETEQNSKMRGTRKFAFHFLEVVFALRCRGDWYEGAVVCYTIQHTRRGCKQ